MGEMAPWLDQADAILACVVTERRDGDGAALRVRTAIQTVTDGVRPHPGAFGGTER